MKEGFACTVLSHYATRLLAPLLSSILFQSHFCTSFLDSTLLERGACEAVGLRRECGAAPSEESLAICGKYLYAGQIAKTQAWDGKEFGGGGKKGSCTKAFEYTTNYIPSYVPTVG
jgi:hypothetical protein